MKKLMWTIILLVEVNKNNLLLSKIELLCMTYETNNNFRESELFTDLRDKLDEDEVRKNIDQ